MITHTHQDSRSSIYKRLESLVAILLAVSGIGLGVWFLFWWVYSFAYVIGGTGNY